MNHSQVTSVDTNNAGTGKYIHNTILQPVGKRKALSTIASRQGNVNIPVSIVQDRNKDYLMTSANSGPHSTREYSRQNFSETAALRQITEQRKEDFGVKFFSYEEPSVLNAKEEEMNSPMVVVPSLENLSLKEKHEDREFLLQEYSQEIYAYLKELEVRLRPRVNYMKKQTDITSRMRHILVDWLVEVCQEYKLDQETLYLAVSYVDRFLSRMAVNRANLQLVGTVCMFIAAKYEEMYPPDVSEFVYITDDAYTKEQVLRMEELVLKVLAFDLSVPTANCFLIRFCSLCKLPAPTVCLARYLCELTLLETEPFLKYLPSETACAALALANHTMGKEMWPSEMQLVTEYTEEDFRECLESLYMLYLVSAYYPQQPIQEKYRLPKYYCVSYITPPPSLPVFYIDVGTGYAEFDL